MQLDLRNVRSTALDLGIYLPLGVALAARDMLLSRDRLSELYEELVDRGRERLGSLTGRTGQRLERISLAGDEAAVEEIGESASGRVAPPVSDELPMEGYDELTAQQVVARLRGLDRDELDRVRAYEREHRSRVTVLQAIEPLMGELPIQGYDRLTADQIVRRLGGLSKAELQAVRDYEARTRSRSSVLERIDSLSG